MEAAAGGCPNRTDVTSGLEARLPGVTPPAPRPRPAQRYRLEIERGARRRWRCGCATPAAAPVLERRLAVTGSSPVRRGLPGPGGGRGVGGGPLPPRDRIPIADAGAAPDEPVAAPEPAAVAPAAAPAAEPATSVAAAPAPPVADPPPRPPSAPFERRRRPRPGPRWPRARCPAAPWMPRRSPRLSRTPARSPRSAPGSALFLGAGGAARVGLGGGATGQAPARTELLLGLQGEPGLAGRGARRRRLDRDSHRRARIGGPASCGCGRSRCARRWGFPCRCWAA